MDEERQDGQAQSRQVGQVQEIQAGHGRGETGWGQAQSVQAGHERVETGWTDTGTLGRTVTRNTGRTCTWRDKLDRHREETGGTGTGDKGMTCKQRNRLAGQAQEMQTIGMRSYRQNMQEQEERQDGHRTQWTGTGI
jgi:hypothetical protein